MLELIEISQIKEKSKILQDFNPDNSLWVVSDIKSQLFVLHKRQHKISHATSKPVIRAKKLWSHWLSIIHPELHIVPPFFLNLIYQKWAQSQKPDWQKNIETGSLVGQYMETLSHLLHHPLKNHLIEEWSKTRFHKDSSWTQWYHLANNFQSYLAEKNIIADSWSSTLLLDKIPFSSINFKNLIFDLSFEIDRIEVELIYQISQRINTQVLVPTYTLHEENQNNIYSIYKHFNQKTKTLYKKKSNIKNTSIKVKKFVSPLAEIKDISHWVSHILQKGIKPNKISVLAPHIENYWLCLKSYCEREKIPVNKSKVVLLSHFPIVQLWLARMWTHLSVIKYENLETICAHFHPQINFSQLKADFYHIRTIEEWPPNTYIKEQIKNKEDLVPPSVFYQWASELLPDKNIDSKTHSAIKECLKHFLKITYLKNTKFLSWNSWLQLLEYLTKQKEIEIHEENPEGINCLSFNAINWVESEFVYIAGLSEQNMKKEKHNIISSLEAEAITENLGFFIKTEPADKQEKIISHFIQQAHEELLLSFASVDFLGTPLNPSRLWLENAIKHKKDIKRFDTPGVTLWDLQQRKTSIKEVLSNIEISDRQIDLVDTSIQNDLGLTNPSPFYQKKVKDISFSSLNNYVTCPFIFTAKHLFHLWDGPVRNIDIPPVERGMIIHKLFEKLLSTKKTVISKKEIAQIVDQMRTHKEIRVKLQKIHPLIWEKEKSWLIQKALLFLKEEKRKKVLFTDYQNIACEKEYHSFWNFEKQSLDNKGDISIKGKIDRVDSNNQFYQIIDYKGSIPVGSTAPSWETQKNFQMPLYIQAIEKGFSDLAPLPVKSALFLSYKNFEYQGLAPKESHYIQLLGSERKRSLISEEEKTSILKNISQKINFFISNIYHGKFEPQPKTKVFCIKCKWRKICRARHLN